MSKWRLVEAEVREKVVEVEENGQVKEKPLTSLRPTAHNPAFEGVIATGNTGTARRRRSSRAVGSMRDRSGTLDDYGLENDESFMAMSPEDLSYATHIACNNIEYLFSTESLVVRGDMYLRSLMDNQGYVPLVYIMQYPDLMYSPASEENIAVMMHANPKCTLEVDLVNSTVRLKDNWSAYLLRNASGGMGLSQRWLKDTSAGNSDDSTTASAPIPIVSPTQTAASLSPSAKEFVSSSPTKADPPVVGSPLRANAFEFVPK